MVKIEVGMEFSSFPELETTLSHYEQQNLVKFYRRDSRTVDSATKRNSKKTYNPILKYSEVTFSCMHGGRQFKSGSKGLQPKKGTYKIGCEAVIKVRAAEDGQTLVVKEVREDHNHEMSELIFNQLKKDQEKRKYLQDLQEDITDEPSEPQPSQYTLEVCVDSLSSAIAAVEGGADRLELCMALSEGGLTPTPGLLLGVKNHINRPVEVFCIVRPRAGLMTYSEGEAEVILNDADTLIRAGADGLVFGALNPDGTIDQELCQHFREAAGDVPCTFHRAFDLVKDPLAELSTVIELGYDRILTSGGKASALEGCEMLAKLVTASGGQVAIMAGAGVKSGNVTQILQATGVHECHASARVPVSSGTKVKSDGPRMGAGDDSVRMVTSREEVQALKEAMRSYQALSTH